MTDKLRTEKLTVALRIERLRMALSDIASWRAGAHGHDDDMGYDRRDFEDPDEWELVERRAQMALDADVDLAAWEFGP